MEEREFPLYLPFKDRTYQVKGYIQDTTEFKDNKGYIDKETGRVYICSKDEPPVHEDTPIIIINNENPVEYELKECHNPSTTEVFRSEYLYDISHKAIIENTSEDDILYNEEALADMNAATSIFIPTINEEDDPLKKIVKQAIISKRIDINRLKHKMPAKYGLTNLKSALITKTKMSITNFIIWCELLGLDFSFAVYDNGKDLIDPLKKTIVYDSSTNRINEEK